MSKMDINPIHESILLLKSKRKFSLFHTIKNQIICDIKIEEKAALVGYALTKDKNNKLILVYVYSNGYLHIFNINDSSESFSKQIVSEDVKAIAIGNDICALYTPGSAMIKIFNLSSYDIKEVPVVGMIENLTIDNHGHNLLYSSKNDLILLSLKSGQNSNIYTSNERINYLKFASDSKLIAIHSSSHFISVIDLKGNAICNLQLSTSFGNFKLIAKEDKNKKKTIYYAFAFTLFSIDVYCIDSIKKSSTSKEAFISSKLTFDFGNKSIINSSINTTKGSITIYYGDIAKIHSKNIIYAKNEVLKEGHFHVEHKEDNNTVEETISQPNQFKVMNDSEIHANSKFIDILEKNEYSMINTNAKLSAIKNKNTEGDKKFTLIDSLNSALANNDNDKFDWVINQKATVNIIPTVEALLPEQVKAFLSKSIERFNTNIQSNLLFWLENLFKIQFINLPKDSLIKLEGILHSRVVNYTLLSETNSKIQLLNDIKVKMLKESNQSFTGKKTEDKPLLVYYESDDEETKEKKKKYKSVLNASTTIKQFKEKQNNQNSKTTLEENIADEDDDFIDDEDFNEDDEIIDEEDFNDEMDIDE